MGVARPPLLIMDKQSFIRDNLYQLSLLSICILPLSILYLFLQIIHRLYFSIFTSSVYNCPIPIISIGNIVSGGSGKTPFTVFLVRYLTKAGKLVAVSHRDYKGKYEQQNQLLSDREGLLPEVMEAGDEAALLAEKLRGIPVIAGKNRKKSLQILANKYLDLDYIILDDSFQHLRVHHDYDFILFQSKAGYGNGFVLPAGILREPLSTLNKADFIVWNGKDPITPRLLSYGKPVLKGRTFSCGIRDRKGNKVALETLMEKNLALISAIGYPHGFEETIHSMGLSFSYHYRLPDHYRYTNMAFIKRLKREFNVQKYDYLITTEKDFIKLRKARSRLPILVVEIEFIPDDESLQYLTCLTD
jgi:tetraacyldisaccharide 4'-kinase